MQVGGHSHDPERPGVLLQFGHQTLAFGDPLVGIGVEGRVLPDKALFPLHDHDLSGLNRDEIVRQLPCDTVGETTAQNQGGGTKRHGSAGQGVAAAGAQ